MPGSLDVLDHPAREEIVRIVNLGVMAVDESLHRFVPEATLRRSEAVASLVRLLRKSRFRPAPGCAVAGARRSAPRASPVASRAIPPTVSPPPPVSGREAIGMLAIVLDRLDGN
ncbi:MAG: hypothetical protein R2862_13035 [Thermoanaerobaculia bacterium]